MGPVRVMNPQLEIVRAWLARACGVTPDRVTEAHVLRWSELSAEIRCYQPTPEQATGIRALAKASCIVPRDSGPAKPEPTPAHVKWYGDRPKLAGEVA